MKNIQNQIFSKLNKDIDWIKNKTIFLTIYGSIAYGLDTPESDIDVRGICTVPNDYLLGFNKNFDQYIVNESIDCTIFNIQKFFSLTSQGNPNTLEMLFTEPEHQIYADGLGSRLLDNRDAFLSKNLKERYIGFARGQMHRLKSHRSFLLNPRENKPTREKCGLSSKPLIDKNQFDVIKSLIAKQLESWTPDFEPFSKSQKIYLQNEVADILTEMQIYSDTKWESAARSIGLDDNLIFVIKKEKEFENKIEEYKNYQKWKVTRNPKRAALEAKYQMDCKHAAQLVRLLTLGKEILETGKVQVKRIHDREQLMAIKNGAWSYENLIEYADKIESEMKIAYTKSKLPNQPNIKLLDSLCIELIEKSLSKYSWYNVKKAMNRMFDETK